MLDGVYGGFYSSNQLIFDKLDVSVPLIGIFFSASYLINSVSYLAAERLAQLFGKERLLKALVMLELLLLSTLVTYRYPALLMLSVFLACILPEMVYVLAESDLQMRAPVQHRNTTLSLLSLTTSLTSSALFVGVGFLMGGAGIVGPLALICLAAGGATGCYLVLARERTHGQSCA